MWALQTDNVLLYKLSLPSVVYYERMSGNESNITEETHYT